jgi:hypothetical protein
VIPASLCIFEVLCWVELGLAHGFDAQTVSRGALWTAARFEARRRERWAVN